MPPLEVVAHRILWSALLCVLFLAGQGRLLELQQILKDGRRLAGLAASSFCIALNWGFFVWAVQQGRAIEAGFGYFIYPLCMVGLGALLLGERLKPRQTGAIGLVFIGVAVLALSQGSIPWLVLVFPVSFSLYGLLRKIIVVAPLTGLAVETLLLSPFAIGLLWIEDGGVLAAPGDWMIKALLVAAGPATTLPLLLFAYAARRLRLSTLGLAQYWNPTLQVGIACLIFREVFTFSYGLCFAFIWGGILLYAWPSRPLTSRDGGAISALTTAQGNRDP